MEDKEFKEKIDKYKILKQQVDKLGKIVKKLNEELKKEGDKRKLEIFETDKSRAAFSSYDRVFPEQDKIKSFLIKSGEKVENYFYTVTIKKLQVVDKYV